MYSTHPDPDAALRETLGLARRAPFYRDHLARADAGSLAELARLPVTSKEDLRKATPWGMIAVPKEELW
ncbi:MAG: phenylacetate--CoA ligase family protein, partial [Candidatus Binatia bacterium]